MTYLKIGIGLERALKSIEEVDELEESYVSISEDGLSEEREPSP